MTYLEIKNLWLKKIKIKHNTLRHTCIHMYVYDIYTRKNVIL